MWELNHKESWASKESMLLNCGIRETFESPLDHRETKPVKPKGNQSWIFTGRTDAEADTPILWPPDVKNWLIWKDPDAGKDWRQEEKGTTKDEMIEWHHWLHGHGFEQAPGVGDGQGSLACCSPLGRKESDTTEWLNWLTEAMREVCIKLLEIIVTRVKRSPFMSNKNVLQWLWTSLYVCRIKLMTVLYFITTLSSGSIFLGFPIWG